MSNQSQPPDNVDAPYDENVEKALIGAVLINPAVFLNIAAFLTADDFFLLRHKYIWEAFERISERQDPIERQTLRRELQDHGLFDQVGGDLYISKLMNSTPTAMYAEQHGRLVERDAVRRRLMDVTAEIRGYTQDRTLSVEDVISRSESALFSVSERRSQRDVVTMREATSRYLDRISHMLQQGQDGLGLPSGFKKLDALLGGLQRSDLLIFAGRPGMGKTSFMLTLALNAAHHYNAHILLFSLEMGVEQLVQRLLAIETGINMQTLRTGQYANNEQNRLIEAIGRLSQRKIFIDDSPSLNPIQMRTKAQRIKHEYGLDLVILDYLQLMHAPGYDGNRVQEISYISRQMKELARELEVPLLSAAQLSRAVEQRADKRPVLSDLRESGCLAGESLVWLPDEGRYEQIQNLAGCSGFRVMSLNTDTYKLEPAEVSNAFCTGTKPVYKMETALGRQIRATGNHKFLTISGWKRLDELQPGDHIAVPRHLFGCAEPTLTDAELALLGHLIGDGCTLPRHSIQYTSVEEDLAQLVADLATEVFGDRISPRIHKEPGRNWYQVFLTASDHLTHNVRNPITDWLTELGVFGLRSHEKRVPDVVFANPPEKIGLFLRHLWATDGCVKFKKVTNGIYPNIYYATSSLTLANDVQSLLLHQGINARVIEIKQKNTDGTRKGRNQYHVIVSGKSEIVTFAEQVYAVGRVKEADIKRVKTVMASRSSSSKRDYIPYGVWNSHIMTQIEQEQLELSYVRRESGMRYYSPDILVTKNLSREIAASMGSIINSQTLSYIAKSDVYWEKIKAIEPNGEAEVFDLTVPSNKNFVANNILPHNSIEQDADIVMFLYRDVVYNEATENPNQADVIVAKHRNGPTDTIPLYFDASATRFRDGTRRHIDLGEL